MTQPSRILYLAVFAAAILLLPARIAAQASGAPTPQFGFKVDEGVGIAQGNAIAVDSKNVYFAWYYLGDPTPGRPRQVLYESFPLVFGCQHIPCGFTPPAPTTVDVISVAGPVESISIGVDPKGVPHIVYQDGQGGLKHAEFCPCADDVNLGWQLETIPIPGGIYTSMAVDKNGAVHVVSSSGGAISYTKKSNGTWSAPESIIGPAALAGLSLAVDSGGNPHVLWSDHRPNLNDLVYSSRGAGPLFWLPSDSEIVTGDWAEWISLALDSNDQAAVAYWGGPCTSELVYVPRQGGFWPPQVVDSFDLPACYTNPPPYIYHNVSLAFSPTNIPLISYGFEHAFAGPTVAGGVALANQDGFFFHTQPIFSTSGGFGALNSTSLVVDAAGISHVLFLLPGNVLVYGRYSKVDTPAGAVTLSFGDPASYGPPITVTYPQVTQAGVTSVSIDDPNNGPAPPPNFETGNPPVYYDFSTTATFVPPATVCIPYGDVSNPSSMAIMHFENGAWVDRTVSNDTSHHIICASVSSFSPIAIFQSSATQQNPTLTITANNAARQYGAPDPTFSVAYSGFVNGDGPATLSGQLACKSNSTPSSPVGSYIIDCSSSTLSSPKYAIAYATGVLTVTPAPLTISANSATKVYGAALPPLGFTISGFVNGDMAASLTTQPTLSTAATAASGVGSYPVDIGGAVDPNYSIAYQPGLLTITPAPLTVTASSGSRPYGANNPMLPLPLIAGIQNGDAISSSYSIAATPASPAGTYSVLPVANGAASVLSNYNISLVNGTLTIVPETTALNTALSSTSISVGQSTTATIMLTAPDMVIPIDPSVLASVIVTSPIASDILSNNGACTPAPTATPGVASCTITLTSVEPNGRTLNVSFAGSANLVASSGTADLVVTAALQSKQVCIKSDFRNVAVAGGNTIWFNSIFKVRDVPKQLIHISFYQSNVLFQYQDASGNLVYVDQSIPDARITIDPNAASASTSFDSVNNVWLTTIPFDFDDNSFLTGVPWLVPAGGIPADIEPVSVCGTFASDVSDIDIGWRWAAAVYSSFGADGTTLGVKPMDTDHDNQGTNHDLAGTPENYKQFVIPGARGKGGKNYTGSYSGSSEIE